MSTHHLFFRDTNIELQPLPGVVEIGPMMTVGKVLAAKPGDPPIKYDERMYQPTPKQLHERCSELLNDQKAKKQQAAKSQEKNSVSESG